MHRFFLLLGTWLPLFTTAQPLPGSDNSMPIPGYRQRTDQNNQLDLLGKGAWHVGLNARGGGYGGFTGFVGRVTPRISYFLGRWLVG